MSIASSNSAVALVNLIGSRICHDIISPLGAIGNGVELLSLSNTVPSAEMSLISDSVQNANARVRFFRIAFGAAEPEATVDRREVVSILDAIAGGGRLRYAWTVSGALPRPDVRAVFLALLCLETALPQGGEIEIQREGDQWALRTSSPALSLDPALWAPLAQGRGPDDITSKTVHFAILPVMLAEAERALSAEHGTDWISLRF